MADLLAASGEPGTAHFDATANPPHALGTVIVGRYKLIEVIGEGGMGTVYMAQQTEPVKRMVAVKVIKAGMDSKACSPVSMPNVTRSRKS